MKDLEIAKRVKLKHIGEIANKFGVSEEHIEMYGKYKAKIPLSFIDEKKFFNLSEQKPALNRLLSLSILHSRPEAESDHRLSLRLISSAHFSV